MPGRPTATTSCSKRAANSPPVSDNGVADNRVAGNGVADNRVGGIEAAAGQLPSSRRQGAAMGRSAEPVYLRVLEDLRMRIREGVLEPGARVPSRNAIITKYGVGETAAKHALQVLATEGLIEAKAGSGSYVRKPCAARYLEHDRLHFPGSPFGIEEAAHLADRM